MSNATNVETKHLRVGDVSYAYRELRPTNLADSTPVVFLHRFRGTLDDWDPAFVDELAKTRHVLLFSDAAVGSSTGTPAKDFDEKGRNTASFARKLGYEQIDVLGFSLFPSPYVGGGIQAVAAGCNHYEAIHECVIDRTL